MNFLGLTRECLITVFNFVKDKATKFTKWKGTKRTAILKDGHDLKSKVIYRPCFLKVV